MRRHPFGCKPIVMTSPVHGPLPSVLGAAITLLGLALAFALSRQTSVAG